MKNLLKVAAFVAALVIPTTYASAQAVGFATTSDTASTTAVIVAPLEITKTQDLNFGEIYAPVTASTAVVTASGTTAGSTVTFSDTTNITAAEFDIVGIPSYAVYYTLPASSYNVEDGLNTMVVSTFTGSTSSPITLSGTGEATLAVGASLAVAAGQAAGTYENADELEVTVEY